MFTGLITDIGTITHATDTGGGRRLSIACLYANLQVGESIACSGTCLTVESAAGGVFQVMLSPETLARTAPRWEKGAKLNLERALMASDRLGGHFVTGHIDAIATVLAREAAGESTAFTIQVPESLQKFIAEKGSVALEGISLTVNQVEGAQFRVTIIPHTLSATTAQGWKVGDKLNLEIDMIARYVEKLLRVGA